MSDTLAVTILNQTSQPGDFILDFRDVNVRYMETLQVSTPDDLWGMNVVSVENKPSHPLFRKAVDRMSSRIFDQKDAGKKYPNSLGK